MRIEKNKPTHLSSVSQFQIFLANYFFNYLISLVIDKQNKYTSSNIVSLHGDEQDRIIAGDEETEVIIDTVYDANEEAPSYTASWTKDDTLYTMSGRINIDELKKIIKFMKYQSDFFRFLTYILCKGMFTQRKEVRNEQKKEIIWSSYGSRNVRRNECNTGIGRDNQYFR